MCDSPSGHAAKNEGTATVLDFGEKPTQPFELGDANDRGFSLEAINHRCGKLHIAIQPPRAYF